MENSDKTIPQNTSRILVTGGAGLIGSHLCKSLLDQGHTVTCVDNFITGRKQNIEHLFTNPNFELIESNVSNASITNNLQPMEQSGIQLGRTTYNYIFHLASPASPVGYGNNPIETYKVNAFGTHYMLELAREHGARILFSSTSEVYGDPLEHPQKESYWGNVNPNGPRSCYDESKRFGEMACMTFFRKFQTDVRLIRIFNTYGPHNDPNDGRVVPNFIMQALKNEPLTMYGDGSQTRSFCYVTDLVKGIEKMMFTDGLAGEVINLGNPVEFTVKELADIVLRLTGSQSTIEYKDLPQDDPKQRRPDISKAKQLLGWEPTIPLEEGLKPTIEYFKGLMDG
jgi:UDP-glucuronate decarboxylase